MFANVKTRGPEAAPGERLDSGKVAMRGPAWRVCCAALCGLLGILGWGGSARGKPLNLHPSPPDVSAQALNVGYNATTGIFSAIGYPSSFALSSGSVYTVTGGSNSYNLTAQISPAGQPLSGSLSITGTIAGLGLSGTLLTGGWLGSFGYQDGGGDVFEFIFDNLGGELAPYFASNQVGLEVTAWGSDFNGGFTNSFTATPYSSSADNFMFVPEPPMAILLLSVLAIGLPVWAYRRWRRASTP